MKYAVAKLLNLTGYGLQIDFGDLTVILWKNAKGKTREIFRGDYMLQIYLLTDKYNKTFSDLNVLYNDIK